MKHLTEQEVADLISNEFCRNIGILSPETQAALINTRVAIAGAGGVGGIHLFTLARLGIRDFNIADMDDFERKNVSRQFGANTKTIGMNKAEAVASQGRDIHSKMNVRVWSEGVSPDNVDDFLDGCSFYIDSMEFFNFDIRRLLFMKAHEKGIIALTVAPLGFGNGVLAFHPDGMSFDEYFGIRDDMPYIEKLARFAVGVAPAGYHLKYVDKKKVSIVNQKGPAVAAACVAAAGWMATMVAECLSGSKDMKFAPHFTNFDMKRHKYVSNDVRTLVSEVRHLVADCEVSLHKKHCR